MNALNIYMDSPSSNARPSDCTHTGERVLANDPVAPAAQADYHQKSEEKVRGAIRSEPNETRSLCTVGGNAKWYDC